MPIATKKKTINSYNRDNKPATKAAPAKVTGKGSMKEENSQDSHSEKGIYLLARLFKKAY